MTFNEMNLPDEIKSALKDMGFTAPTPVQEEVIPFLLDGRDVLAQAPTGTGKTCAFGIPAICNIDPSLAEIQALILCPTRELVVQIEREIKEVLKYTEVVKTVSIYGGQSIDAQMAKLRKKPHIVIGTTGRVMDHMRRKTIKLDALCMLVLDEVDEMLNMGFREDVDTILESVPKGIQTVFFSATVPQDIEKLSRAYQRDAARVTVAREKSDTPLISQYYIKTDEKGKLDALAKILRSENYMRSLVFCKTKKRVEEIATELSRMGFPCDVLHGDLLQRHRDRAMKKFREGKTEVLVATDVAARGLDIDDLQAVFNFDLPQDEEYYVHRIGRTARANKTGASYTFISKRQMYAIENLERATGGTMLPLTLPEAPLDVKISDKRFKKTLKLISKEDLTPYKEYITDAMLTKGEEGTDILDIAAALLLQLSRADEFAIQPDEDEKPRREKSKNERPDRKERSEKSDRPESADRLKPNTDANTSKFFLNIGEADKLSQDKMIALIMEYTEVPPTAVTEIIIKDTFSFVKVKKENAKAFESLNGSRYNKRSVVVDLCDDKKGGKQGKPFDKKFTKSPDKFKQNKGNPRGKFKR